MSGLMGAIDVAASGAQAFEQGVAIVSQNIANQTTPGYAAEQLTPSTVLNAGSSVGGGVQSTVSRAMDGLAAGVLRAATSANSAAGVMQASFTSLSSALTNNGNVQSSINQFIQDMSTLAGNPTSTAQRQTVLSDAQVVTGSFQSAASSITTAQKSAVTSLNGNVTQANALLSQLASINASLTNSPNNTGLLDQQQSALQSLSALVQFNTVPLGGNGAVMLAAGGTVLLNQAGAQSLAVKTGGASSAPSVVVGASSAPLPDAASGGSIGANLAAWQAGAQAQGSLNALTAIFADQINTAQAQGLTAGGQQGAALFSISPPSATANSANTGSAQVTAQISNPSALPTSGSTYAMSYSSSAGWSALDQTTGKNYALGFGSKLSLPGLTLSIAGTPAQSDSFTINPSPGAAAGIALATTDPNAIAAADPYVVTPGQAQSGGSIVNSNGGNVAAGASSVTTTPASGAVTVPQSYFGQPLEIQFSSASNFNVTTTASPATVVASGSLSGGSSTATIAIGYPSGSAAGGSYWQIPISGTAASGDVLSLTTGGTGSGSNALRMQSLWTANTTTAQGSMQQAFVSLTTGLGVSAQQATTTQASTALQVTTATTNLQSVAGVDLNQQAVLLTQYQAAFQASAQVIAGANTMFQSLLKAV
jgi:flagellar hook-associated protein 1 FlgK